MEAHPIKKFFGDYIEFPISQYLMAAIHQSQEAENPLVAFLPNLFDNVEYKFKNGRNIDVAQDTYLMSRDGQRRKFYEAGYIAGEPGDYGLVRKATLDLNRRRNDSIPVFQRAPDAVSRDQLEVIGNADENVPVIDYLEHAGTYPTAVYVDPSTGYIYSKGWDLNDYGPTNGGFARREYTNKAQALASQLDLVGQPVVVTTGYQPVLNRKGAKLNTSNYRYTYSNPEIAKMIANYLKQDTTGLDEEYPVRIPY